MGLHRPEPASREYLARLVAVVVVLAGLVLLHSPVCSDGMSMAAGPWTTPTAASSLPASSMSTADGSRMAGIGVDAASADLSAVAEHHRSGPHGFSSREPDGARDTAPGGEGGVLATCLVFIAAALVALAALARPSRSGVSAPRLAPVLALAPSPGPGPDLARLCILRT